MLVSSCSIYHCSSPTVSSGKTDLEGEPPFPVIASVLVSAPSLCAGVGTFSSVWQEGGFGRCGVETHSRGPRNSMPGSSGPFLVSGEDREKLPLRGVM